MRILTKPSQPADLQLMQHNSLTAQNNLMKHCVSVHDKGQVDKTERLVRLTTAEHKTKYIGLFCQREIERNGERERVSES